MAQMKLSIKRKRALIHREQTCGCLGRGRRDGPEIGNYKPLHLERINKVVRYVTGNDI